MKKIVAALLASLMLLSVMAAAAQAPVTGGWGIAKDTEITNENLALFDKALNGLDGVSYQPIAYLGNQVVAGFNHCFLCKATVVHPDALPRLALVYIFEDLKGNAEITNVFHLDLAALSVRAEPGAE